MSEYISKIGNKKLEEVFTEEQFKSLKKDFYSIASIRLYQDETIDETLKFIDKCYDENKKSIPIQKIDLKKLKKLIIRFQLNAKLLDVNFHLGLTEINEIIENEDLKILNNSLDDLILKNTRADEVIKSIDKQIKKHNEIINKHNEIINKQEGLISYLEDMKFAIIYKDGKNV